MMKALLRSFVEYFWILALEVSLVVTGILFGMLLCWRAHG